MRGATLRDHGGKGPPVVLVPSLINPPRILDLDEQVSLTGAISRMGRRSLLLDWGDADNRSDLSVTGHIEELLIPLLRSMSEPAALLGYCLGGTMSIAAANLAPVSRVVTLAAPWHFTGYLNIVVNLEHYSSNQAFVYFFFQLDLFGEVPYDAVYGFGTQFFAAGDFQFGNAFLLAIVVFVFSNNLFFQRQVVIGSEQFYEIFHELGCFFLRNSLRGLVKADGILFGGCSHRFILFKTASLRPVSSAFRCPDFFL
jgi:hypothetical protein